MFSASRILIAFLILIISIKTSDVRRDLNEHVVRNRGILSYAPLIPDLIQSRYSNDRKWKAELKKEVTKNPNNKRLGLEFLRLVSMKEFESKLAPMAKWLMKNGVNDPKNTALTQTLSQSLSDANLMHLHGVNPPYILDMRALEFPTTYANEIYRRGGRKFYLIDDAIFYGSKMITVMQQLKQALTPEQKREITVYLAAPFMSRLTANTIQHENFEFNFIYYPAMEGIPVASITSIQSSFAVQHRILDDMFQSAELKTAIKTVGKKLYGTLNSPYTEIDLKLSDKGGQGESGQSDSGTLKPQKAN